MVKFSDTLSGPALASDTGESGKTGRYSNSSERGMSVASAEMHYLSTARWRSALMAAVLFLSASVAAQDAPPAGETDNGEGAAREASGEPVERYFIRSTGDSGRLAQRYPHLAVWLEPEGAPRVLALVEREVTETPKGGVVILADEGQTANDALIEGLRGRLTEAGWATLSLGNDQVSPTLQLARQRLETRKALPGDESSQADQPVMIDVNDQAAEAILETQREEMNARLHSAVSWLQERDYARVLLVGVGRGALAINDYLPEAPEVVTGLAWIAPDFGARAPGELASGLEEVTVRLLDMYPSRSSSGEQRRAAFRRAGVAGYKALPVPLAGGEAGRHAAAIGSRLAGWAEGG